MALTREQSLQEIGRSKIEIPEEGVSYGNIQRLFMETSRLEPSQRQLSLAEAATRTFLSFLAFKRPLYPEFESLIWQQFLRSSNLQKEIELLLDSELSFAPAQQRYCLFIRGMFERSQKTRQQFYSDMIAEAGIPIGLNTIGFGEAAASFLKLAMKSMHREHLLVFCSVELLIRTYAAVRPGSPPLLDKELEAFYKHFEYAIPLITKFGKYTREDDIFTYSAVHWMLPSIG